MEQTPVADIVAQSAKAPSKLPTTSASQFEMYDLCKRKFYFTHVDGISIPQGPQAAFGERIHDVLHKWLDVGLPPSPDTPEGRTALPGIDYLPAPGTLGMKLEGWLSLPITLSGVTYALWRGRFDLIVLARRFPLVHDHKTTGNFRYAKNPAELAKSPQMISYAHYTLEELAPSADGVVLSHLYLHTGNPPAARPVVTQPIVRSQIADRWEEIEEKAHGLIQLKLQKPGAQNVEPQPTACDAFGGCPHRERCNLPKGKELGAIMSNFLDDLLKKGATVSTASLPPVTPPVTTAAAVVAAPKPEIPTGYYCPDGYNPIAPGPNGAPRMTNHTGKPFWMPKVQERPVSILPPDAPPRDSYKTLDDIDAAKKPQTPPPEEETTDAPLTTENPLAALQAKADEFKAAQAAALAPVVAAPAPSPVVAAPAPSPVVAALAPVVAAPPITIAGPEVTTDVPAPIEGKRGPGRPRKGTSPPVAPAPTSAQVAAVAEMTAAKDEFQAADPLVIWVDVGMIKGTRPVTMAEDWVRPALDRAAQLAGAGVVDWRAADYHERGKGFLFAALAEHAKVNGVPSGIVFLRSSMAGFDAVLEFLVPHALEVVAPAYAGRR